MDEEGYRAFAFDFLRRAIGTMYDDVSPKEIVDWLLSNWPKDQPSKDEVLRHLLEHVVEQLKAQLPTWFQIHQGLVTGKDPYTCERKVTPRPPGAGPIVDSMDDLRADVVRHDLRRGRGGCSSFVGLRGATQNEKALT